MNVFNLQYESFGEIISVPLIPDGENTLVTADNRQDFVDRLVQVRPNSSPSSYSTLTPILPPFEVHPGRLGRATVPGLPARLAVGRGRQRSVAVCSGGDRALRARVA